MAPRRTTRYSRFVFSFSRTRDRDRPIRMARSNTRKADDEEADEHSSSVVWSKKENSCRDCCLFTLVVLAVILGVFLFLIVGPLLCFLRMKRVTRVIILWFWLVMASIVVGMILAFDIYVPVDISCAGSEQLITSRALSTFMCKGVTVTATDHDITSYIFDGQPPMTENKLDYSFERTDTVDIGSFQAYPFYMLAGSSLSFTMNTTSSVTFFNIRGEGNFSTWKQNYLCEGGDCFDDFRTVENQFSYNASWDETDIYYIAFAKTKFNDHSQALIDVKFDVLRTLYNVSSALNTCAGFICSFDYPFMSKRILLLQTPVLEHDYFETITTKCVHRDVVYLIAFFAGPLVLGTILNLIIWFACKRCDPEDDNEVIPIKSGLRAAGDMARRYSAISIGRTVNRRDDDSASLNKNMQTHEEAESRENSWPT